MRPSTLINMLSVGALACAALASCSGDRVAAPEQGVQEPENTGPEATDDPAPLSADDEASPAISDEADPVVEPAARAAEGDLEEPAAQGFPLRALSSREAPAPTRTFFWGKAALTAPGFHIPPSSTLTIALDADNRLRYLSVGDFAALPKSFGDGDKEFPLSGMKHVDLNPEYRQVLDCSVDSASMSTPTYFLFRMRVEGGSTGAPGTIDYVESLEGHAQDGGWAVVYTEKGELYAAQIDARGEALLHSRDPQTSAPLAGQPSVWSAPVELVAPGFFGTPVDHFKVALAGNGQLRSFGFRNFARKKQAFGTGQDAFPLSGAATVGALRVTVDAAVSPTPEHFVVRYRVEDGELSDYVEGLDGTREGNTLVVRYFIKGKLWGASIDAHAAGTLVPSSEDE